MEHIQSYTDKLTDWLERILLKGINKIDTKDMEELESLQESALGYEMSFLAQLLAELAIHGKSYTRAAQAEMEPLIVRYLYVAQYVHMMKQSA
ncbi:hypothetical protein [Brevibacillus sp. NRS-1366]|uniref:hypothetical protein n=1 Tax=Brevibacillus sp. NRS-1366 TaxID=3233899 RepID=UPI003D1D0DE4